MTHWTIGIDATVSVSVEAKTQREAEDKACTIADKWARKVRLGKKINALTVLAPYVVVNDDTGEETLK